MYGIEGTNLRRIRPVDRVPHNWSNRSTALACGPNYLITYVPLKQNFSIFQHSLIENLWVPQSIRSQKDEIPHAHLYQLIRFTVVRNPGENKLLLQVFLLASVLFSIRPMCPPHVIKLPLQWQLIFYSQPFPQLPHLLHMLSFPQTLPNPFQRLPPLQLQYQNSVRRLRFT